MGTGTSIRLLSAVVAAIALVAGLPGGAAGRSAPVVLGGTNVITATRTAVMEVSIPRETSVSIKQGTNPDVAVSGKGRFVGIMLGEDRVGDVERVNMVAGRATFCDGARCPNGTPSEQLMLFRGPWNEAATRGSLPAGDYLLHVITEGAPVKVTLELEGLRGTRRLTPQQPVDSEVGNPTTRHYESATKTLYTNGDVYDWAGPGVRFGAVRIDSDAWVAGKLGNCAYRGDPPPAIGFLPGCPAGSDAGLIYAVANAAPSHNVWFGITETSVGGRWGLGDSYAAAAAIKDVRAVTFDIDLD